MLIATSSRVYALQNQVPCEICTGEATALAEGETYQIIAHKNGDLTIRSGERTETITTGIEYSIECLIILNESPLELLIGTGESHIYCFEDGKTERIESFDQMPVREKWYTPWGGPPDVRSFAATPDGYVYADIHVGSIIRSSDRGQTWQPVTPDLHEDVHQVATSSQKQDRIYANTARAVYISEDRGQSWTHRAEGFPYKYGRAIAVHPTDPDCLLATISKGPHGDAQGQLYRSTNAGQSWQHMTNGFPKSVSHNIDTFHIAFSQDGHAWAVDANTLYTSTDRGQSWNQAWQAPENIQMIACH